MQYFKRFFQKYFWIQEQYKLEKAFFSLKKFSNIWIINIYITYL